MPLTVDPDQHAVAGQGAARTVKVGKRSIGGDVEVRSSGVDRYEPRYHCHWRAPRF
jgi:hypothetical protein